MEIQATDMQLDTVDNGEIIASWDRRRTSEELFGFINARHESLVHDGDIE